MKSPSVQDRHPWLRVPDLIAINTIVVIAAAAAVVSMIESYTNLLDFAENHQYHGWRADIAPSSVDTFIIIGEFLLFVAVYRTWNTYRELGRFKMPGAMVAWGWSLALFGFTLSVLGNLGHLHSADPVTRIMSAVFPVSATIAMASVLMILKRVVQDYARAAAAKPDIRPHGELMYQLGGYAPPRSLQPVPVPPPASKRKRAVTQTSKPALVPELPSARPRIVPDPDPKPGQVSRPIEITPDAWAALESGASEAQLSARHPSLGSRHRVKQIVQAYREGRLTPGTREDVDGAPVTWPGSNEQAEVAYSSE